MVEQDKIVKQIMDYIDAFAEKHELAKEAGADYIYQNDEASADALDLVANIFDVYAGYYCSDEKEEEE